jgi:hypothetical protein
MTNDRGVPVKENKKTAILVAYNFVPINFIASQRALRMARALLGEFHNVYVLTSAHNLTCKKFLDFSLGRDVLNNPRLHLVELRPLLHGYGLVENTKLWHRIIGALLTRLFCSSGIDWVIPLNKALREINKLENVNIVLVTGPPFVPLLAASNFARKNNIPCIIDYRDLWSQNLHSTYPVFSRYLVRNMIERKFLDQGKIVTTVSNGLADSIKIINPAIDVRVLFNTPDIEYVLWFKDQRLDDNFQDDYFNIVYTGTIYKECTFRLLVCAIKGLQAHLRLKIRVHYFGLSKKIIESDFNHDWCNELLVNHGYVSKKVACQAVIKADLLLSLIYDEKVNHHSHDTIQISGLMSTKIFDYFLSGNAIVNIGPDNADINIFANKIGYSNFFNFDSNREAELSQFISNAMNNLDIFRSKKSNISLPDFSSTFNDIIQDAI